MDENFKYTRFNLFLNPYFEMILWTCIIAVVWYYLCKCGRKHCGKKEPLLEKSANV